jgi:protein-disulfide isomerase
MNNPLPPVQNTAQSLPPEAPNNSFPRLTPERIERAQAGILFDKPLTLPQRVQLFDTKDQLVLGNPNAPTTITAFFTPNSIHSKAELRTYLQFVNNNPDVKIILKSWPSSSKDSRDSSLMLMAAASSLSPEHRAAVEDLLKQVGVSAEKIDSTDSKASDPALGKKLDGHGALARSIGLNGVPSAVTTDGKRHLGTGILWENLLPNRSAKNP